MSSAIPQMNETIFAWVALFTGALLLIASCYATSAAAACSQHSEDHRPFTRRLPPLGDVGAPTSSCGLDRLEEFEILVLEVRAGVDLFHADAEPNRS